MTDPAREYTDEKVLLMWPQALGELRGFAAHLARSGSGLTAAQLRMALELAEDAYRRIRDGPAGEDGIRERISGAIQSKIDQFGQSSIFETDLMRGSIGGLTTALRIARETPTRNPDQGAKP